MLTECDEVAAAIAGRMPAGTIPTTLDGAREVVRRLMPEESEQVIDNAAWALMLCGRAVAP